MESDANAEALIEFISSIAPKIDDELSQTGGNRHDLPRTSIRIALIIQSAISKNSDLASPAAFGELRDIAYGSIFGRQYEFQIGRAHV